MRLTPSPVWLGLLALAVLSGCQKQPKSFHMRGEVMGKNLRTGELNIRHGDIPGYMSAMTMEYKVKDPSVVAELQPGDKIAADLVASKNPGDYWLENVVITQQSDRPASVVSAASHILAPGDVVPDIALVNQDGKTIRLSKFKGEPLLVTFIYTRCPLANFCPLITRYFASIHKDLANTLDSANTHLLSISLDPKFDKPAVLRRYGLTYLENDPRGFQHWDFAAPSASDLKKLADAFGLEYFEEDNQITHSMTTVLISADGRVSDFWHGSEWDTKVVLQALRAATHSGTTNGQVARK